MTIYPNGIDGSTQIPVASNKVTPVDSTLFNSLRDAVLALESELGIKPSGLYTTVRLRLDALEGGGSTPTGNAGGDLGDTYPNPTVVGLQGLPISTTAPSTNQALIWNGSEWIPGDVTSSSTLSGDVTGDIASNVVETISGDGDFVSINLNSIKWKTGFTPILTQEAVTNPLITPAPFSIVSQAPHPSGDSSTGAAGSMSFTIPESVGGASAGSFYFTSNNVDLLTLSSLALINASLSVRNVFDPTTTTFQLVIDSTGDNFNFIFDENDVEISFNDLLDDDVNCKDIIITAQQTSGAGSATGGNIFINGGDCGATGGDVTIKSGTGGTINGNISFTSGLDQAALIEPTLYSINLDLAIYGILDFPADAGTIRLTKQFDIQARNNVNLANINILSFGISNTDEIKIGDNGVTVSQDYTTIINTLENQAGRIVNVTALTDSDFPGNTHTLSLTDHYVSITALVAPVDLVLPSSPSTGQHHFIKDTDGGASSNNITITTSDASTIDGSANYILNTDYQSAFLVFTGTDWSLLKVPPSTVAIEMSPIIVPFVAGDFSTDSGTDTRIGGSQVDMSLYPVTLNSLTRSVKFVSDYHSSDAGATAEVKLYDATHTTAITGASSTTTNTSTTNFTSAALTVGSSAGNIRNDVATQYEVQINTTGGAPGDRTFCINAYLLIQYS